MMVASTVIADITMAPGSEIEIVAGRGHGIYLEDPDWFANKLGEFLERHAA